MRVLVALAAVVLIGLTGCGSVESDPDQVTINFTWTAVGDDGDVGQASLYDFRTATDSMTLLNDWANAREIDGEPAPAMAGTPEAFTVTLELANGTTHYFALKVADEWCPVRQRRNWSQISNLKTVFVADDRPPGAVIDLDLTVQ